MSPVPKNVLNNHGIVSRPQSDLARQLREEEAGRAKATASRWRWAERHSLLALVSSRASIARCALILSLVSSCNDPQVAQATNAESDCGTAMRELPMPKLERIILRVSGDVGAKSVSEIVEYYQPKFAGIGIELRQGEEACASGELFMHYDLSGPGAGRMITCRAGREFDSKLNGDRPPAEFVRIGLENVYQQEKCRRQGRGELG